MLVYHSEDLIPISYTDSDFQSNLDFRKSTLGCGHLGRWSHKSEEC